ncbi:hypothetical protein [Actinacidiphila glaucinigra]|uniref:hypothetical protein n=1 Tax=Actinacidiphila glaucinigra TaxID=235986 RepID=UPI002E3712C1|nr:hypothetical protein [Actinacidiphila glaucinigra]
MSARTGPGGTDRLEDVLREALAARAAGVGAGDLRPARPPSSAGVRRHWLRTAAATAAVALAAAVAAAFLLGLGTHERPRDPSVVPAGPSVSPTGAPGPTASPGRKTSAPVPAPPSAGPAERSGPVRPEVAPR